MSRVIKVTLTDEDIALLDIARRGEPRSGYVRMVLRGEWSRHPPKPGKTDELRAFITAEIRAQGQRLYETLSEMVQPVPDKGNAPEARF